MKLIKALSYSFFCLLLVALILFGGIYYVFQKMDLNAYKQYVTKEIEARTGQAFEINGPFDIDLFPFPKADMADAKFTIVDKNGGEYEIQAKYFDLKLDPIALLNQKIEVEAFVAEKVNIITKLKDQEPYTVALDKLSGSMSFDGQSVRVNSFKLKADFAELKGNLKVDWSKETPVIKAKLNAKKLNLADILGNNKGENSQAQGKIFSDKPFAIEGLNKLEADIALEVNHWQLGKFPLEDIKLNLQLKDGELKITPFAARLANGTINADVNVKAIADNSLDLSMNLKIDKVVLSELITDSVRKQQVQGGNLFLDTKIKGHGQSVSQIMGNLNGDAFLRVGRIRFLNVNQKAAISGATGEIVDFLNPLNKKKRSYSSLDCIVALIDIKHGMANAIKNVGVETNSFNVLGSGNINLKTENINFEIVIDKKKGINLGLGSYDKHLHVGGTLASPALSVNPKGVAKDGASIISALATGGMSLIVGQLMSTVTKMGPPCQAIANKR